MGKTLCFTGHRLNKLNGYEAKDNLKMINELRREIIDAIENKGVTTYISGMALGVGTINELEDLYGKGAIEDVRKEIIILRENSNFVFTVSYVETGIVFLHQNALEIYKEYCANLN